MESNRRCETGVSGGEVVPLTPVQYRFMLALQARLTDGSDVGPTYEDLRKDMGLASKSSIARLVRECEERGWIRRKRNRERSLTIIRPARLDGRARENLLDAFSDRELLHEVQRRGLLRVEG